MDKLKFYKNEIIKKLTILSLVLSMSLLAACGTNDAAQADSGSSRASSSQPFDFTGYEESTIVSITRDMHNGKPVRDYNTLVLSAHPDKPLEVNNAAYEWFAQIQRLNPNTYVMMKWGDPTMSGEQASDQNFKGALNRYAVDKFCISVKGQTDPVFWNKISRLECPDHR